MSSLRPLVLVAALLAACGGGAAARSGDAPAVVTVPVRPLAGMVPQRVVVAPAFGVREGDPLGWSAAIPRRREWLRALDDEIAFELRERGVAAGWVLPDALARGYQRNPTLSPDPYRLAVEPLRGVGRMTGEMLRIPEPLATQVRTLVAVHDGRFVLIPVDVAFERVPDAGGRAMLRLMLIDARTSEIRWIGEVRSDPQASLTPAVTASLGMKVADLVAAP